MLVVMCSMGAFKAELNKVRSLPVRVAQDGDGNRPVVKDPTPTGDLPVRLAERRGTAGYSRHAFRGLLGLSPAGSSRFSGHLQTVFLAEVALVAVSRWRTS